MINSNHYYLACAARDARFDGVFFVGVSSTGIYCRPICTAKLPKESNCLFFASAAAAELAHFRPCLRCRPELAPGNAPIDEAQGIARSIVDSLLDATQATIDWESLTARFKLSTRQLRRIVKQQLGVTPLQLLQTRRLLLAKQLLTETHLPIIEIAFASGFNSLRRFNSVFAKVYHMPPSQLRKTVLKGISSETNDSSTLQLSYRPPYDWEKLLSFLKDHLLKGVECVRNDTYYRTVSLKGCQGWIGVKPHPTHSTLLVEFSHSLVLVLPLLLEKLRHLLDLNAQPMLIAEHLSQDPYLAPKVNATLGLRVPGAFDGFELAVRTILGQQISVKAATTVASRFIAAFAEPILTPIAELTYLTPTAGHIAELTVDEISQWGIISNRSKSIIALAKAVVKGDLKFKLGMDPTVMIEELIKLPGIGPWTAHYIAMRALGWPDAFPKEDLAIRNHLGKITARQAEELSQKWRPWRSYAVMHIWDAFTVARASPQAETFFN